MKGYYTSKPLPTSEREKWAYKVNGLIGTPRVWKDRLYNIGAVESLLQEARTIGAKLLKRWDEFHKECCPLKHAQGFYNDKHFYLQASDKGVSVKNSYDDYAEILAMPDDELPLHINRTNLSNRAQKHLRDRLEGVESSGNKFAFFPPIRQDLIDKHFLLSNRLRTVYKVSEMCKDLIQRYVSTRYREQLRSLEEYQKIVIEVWLNARRYIYIGEKFGCELLGSPENTYITDHGYLGDYEHQEEVRFVN